MNSAKNNYLVSVVIPTFNGGEKLKKAIDSIINQSIGFENIELIIVDDASNDKITQQTILKYQSQYPHNIKCFFINKNSGYPGKARNIGMKHTTSKYIIFLDDDDLYLENAVETLYNKINQYNSDLAICNYYININDNKVKAIGQLNENIININPLEKQINYDKLNIPSISVPVARIYKKDILSQYNLLFIEDSVYEDVHFYLNCLNHIKKISIFPHDIIYIYNRYEDSLCHKHEIELFNNLIYSIYCISDILKDINLNVNSAFEILSSLLIIFSNLDNNLKYKAVLKIYKLEKYLEKNFNFNFNLKRKEMNILNTAIMQKKFRKAIFISNIYKILYNNPHIQKIYYKLGLG